MLVFGKQNSSYWFSPFGGGADYSRKGSTVFYRIRNPPSPKSNLQCLILSAFALPKFDYTQIMVITYYKLPHMRATDNSAVSNTIN